MTDDRSLERAARSWLEDGPTRAPDRALEAVLHRIETTPQERDLRVPWRLPKMTTPARVAAAAMIGVLAIGGAIYAFGPGGSSFGGPGSAPSATPSATPSPTPSPTVGVIRPDQLLPPGRYGETPFGPGGMGVCSGQVGCTETAADDTIRFTFTVPDGWIGGSVHSIYLAEGGKAPPAGAGMIFSRGGGLYAEPCGDEPPPNIPVGPTVDDFVGALVDHPKLDVTTPIDVTLGGYAGKYVDLQVPSDISACPASYFPWEPGIYAQGPGSRWHLWILDVDGIRVVVQSTDYVGTSPQRQVELRAIVESIQIEP